jgi:DNA-binding MarR family transcriptional regulator
MMSATTRYCKMWTEWKKAVPERLAAEDPLILSRYLTHASSEAGVSRSDLKRELGLKQPRVSKLSTKLRDEKWIENVPKSQGDGRVEFIRTTSIAKKVMANLEDVFSTLSPPPPVARPVGARGGRLQVPENAIGSLLEAQTPKVQAK